MAKVKITQEKLNEIISESIKKVLNEIGDTPQGRETLRRAANKAWAKGREGQACKFLGGRLESLRAKYGEGVHDGGYIYTSERNCKVEIFDDGSVRIIDNYGQDMDTNLSKIVSPQGADMRAACQTQDRKLARQIAGYCGECVNIEDDATKQACMDWHTWAAL